MSTATPLADRLRRVFAPNPRGVVGVVDELLAAGRECSLRLEWRDGICRAHLEGDGAESVEVSLPKSVFRAMLARLAALCNERTSESVTPYGGRGGVAAGAGVFRVAFVNTPGEQWLELESPGAMGASAVPTSGPVGATESAGAAPPGSA